MWRIYGTGNGGEHPFIGEVGHLLHAIPGARRDVTYKPPAAR